MDYSANIERFSGFADVYDHFRPAPPVVLGVLLPRLAGVDRPRLVVDLGSGTGLSTRFWAARTERVTGIEPSADMRARAEAATTHEHVTYRDGYAHATGLQDACADIVTCVQSLHWMEPQPAFEEIKRILRPGGVFAAVDYDWPPLTGAWEADQAYEETLQMIRYLEKQQPGAEQVKHWEKEGHLGWMQASRCFRYTREFAVHHVDQGNAERLVGIALSQGGVMTLLKGGMSEASLGLVRLRAIATKHLGAELKDWHWTARVRMGIV